MLTTTLVGRTRRQTSALPHQRLVSLVSKLLCITQSLWTLHHHPLLNHGFQAHYIQMQGNIIRNTCSAKLQLALLKSSSELLHTACLSQVKQSGSELHLTIHISKMSFQCIQKHIQSQRIKHTQVILCI